MTNGSTSAAVPAPPEPVTKQSFRDGMAKLAAAVSVVTSNGPGGLVGATVSAVCSLTDTPPTLIVCINRSSRSHAAIAKNQILSVNVLGGANQHVAHIFAGGTGAGPAERFEEVHCSVLATGAPVIDTAVVSFDCEIAQTTDFGTHTVFIARVLAMRMEQGSDGLVYFDRRYLSTGDATRVGVPVPLSLAYDLDWTR
jgi:flavin reductase